MSCLRNCSGTAALYTPPRFKHSVLSTTSNSGNNFPNVLVGTTFVSPSFAFSIGPRCLSFIVDSLLRMIWEHQCSYLCLCFRILCFNLFAFFYFCWKNNALYFLGKYWFSCADSLDFKAYCLTFLQH